ncbi:uncharacterized protein MKK02DRAFT_43795 [Dioszegia hungarica]|uniref:Uncharacterized protein n=1 Tax=Dioszegia hungarica TaxID=4972 RepID=A0AA38LTR4_9TREE|nr:uncharacterized protein MKK02DRAFT_43795 [Dioszegia hungarica]KAI9635115.1 hypothetical protein MKK02DRAFT_43795 [Dioszegia hungarica]
MNALRSKKVFVVTCAVIAPVSFFGGTWLKDYFIERKIANEGVPERQLRTRTRIAALQQEKSELLKEGEAVDLKILELRKRISGSP